MCYKLMTVAICMFMINLTDQINIIIFVEEYFTTMNVTVNLITINL